MKKLFFILFLSIFFSKANCTAQNSSFLKAENYGEYHNELLKIYFEKYSKQENKDFKILFNNMLIEFEKLHPNLVTKEEIDFYSKRVEDIFGNNTDISKINFNEIINNTAKMYYSPKLQEFFIDIFIKNESPKLINLKIEKLKSNKSLSKYELNEIIKFESVYNASQLFWSPIFANSNYSTRTCNPHHQIFICDAAGMLFGGWGALIFSAFCQEAQDQNGGGCIN